MEMETGVVKWYNIQKRFGFIIDENSQEIFFHFGDGENIAVIDGKPEFTSGGLKRQPQQGNCVIFERGRNYKGSIASPWGFADDYERAQREIAGQDLPTYRVLKYKNAGEEPTGSPKILWLGCYLHDLCRNYPRTGKGETDRLHPAFTLALCGIEPAIWFERLDKDGWVQCEDPRPIESK